MSALSLPENETGSIPFFVFTKKLLESLDTGRTFVNALQAAFDLQPQLELYPKHKIGFLFLRWNKVFGFKRLNRYIQRMNTGMALINNFKRLN